MRKTESDDTDLLNAGVIGELVWALVWHWGRLVSLGITLAVCLAVVGEGPPVSRGAVYTNDPRARHHAYGAQVPACEWPTPM